MGVQVKRAGGGAASSRRKPAAAAASSDEDESDDDESSESSEDEKPAAKPATKPAAKPAAAPADADEDSDWSGDDDEDDDESEEDEAYKGLTGRDRWVKRPGSEKKSKNEKADEKKILQGEAGGGRRGGLTPPAPPPKTPHPSLADKHKKLAAAKTAKQDAKAAALAALDASQQQGLQQQQLDLSALEGKTPEVAAIMGQTWTKETLEARVREELASRGRRGTDVRTVALRLAALAEISHRFGPRVSIPTMLHAIAARFDTSRGLDAFLERATWKRSLRDLAAILSILEANPELRLAPVRSEDMAQVMLQRRSGARGGAVEETGELDANEAADLDAAAAAVAQGLAASDDDPNLVRVVGDLSVLLDRLHDEYIKSLCVGGTGDGDFGR